MWPVTPCGFAPRQYRIARLVGQRFPVQLVACAAVELEVAGAGHGIGARLLERLAAVARLDLRQLLLVVRDGGREFHEQAPALDGGQPAPRSVERRARRADRRVDVGCAAARDAGVLEPGRRVHDRQRLAARRRDPAIVDEDVFAVHGLLTARRRRTSGAGGACSSARRPVRAAGRWRSGPAGP